MNLLQYLILDYPEAIVNLLDIEELKQINRLQFELLIDILYKLLDNKIIMPTVRSFGGIITLYWKKNKYSITLSIHSDSMLFLNTNIVNKRFTKINKKYKVYDNRVIRSIIEIDDLFNIIKAYKRENLFGEKKATYYVEKTYNINILTSFIQLLGDTCV